MNEKFGKLLLNLDLTPTQVKIYLSVLGSGVVSVAEIATDTKISRNIVYTDTKILRDKGFLETAVRRPVKFLAVQPDFLQDVAKKKQSEISELIDLMPQVGNFFTSVAQEKNLFKIIIYEGRDVKKLFEKQVLMAKNSEILLILGDVESQEFYLDKKYYFDYTKALHKHNVKLKILTNIPFRRITDMFHTNYKNYEIRPLASLNFQATIDIWDKNVILSSFMQKYSKSVLIENQSISQLFRELFNKFW